MDQKTLSVQSYKCVMKYNVMVHAEVFMKRVAPIAPATAVGFVWHI